MALATSQPLLRRFLYPYGLPSTGGYYVNTGNIVPSVQPVIQPVVQPTVLPSTGGYYINTGNVVPNIAPNIAPTILPSTGGYYVNTANVVPTTNLLPSTGGYYINTANVVPIVEPAVLPSTGGYYINTGAVMPTPVSPTIIQPGPVVSPYPIVNDIRPVATQKGITGQTVNKCDASCATCTGPGSDECLICVEGRYPQRLEGKNTFVCLLHKTSS